jgi:hypothetical protein
MKVIFEKTNFKKVTVAVMAAIIGLASCSTNDVVNNVDNGNGVNAKSDKKSVTLKIASNTPSMPSTRSEGTPLGKSKVDFNSGWLLFVSEQNNVTKVMEITTTNPVPQEDNKVDISLLTQEHGVEITDVPGHSKYVYVIGNMPANLTTPVIGANLTALKETVISLSSQSEITNVTLFGGGEIKNESLKLVAQFSLYPVVARIEIGKISAVSSSDLKSFKVEGIFINNYYENVTLNGDASVIAVNNGDVDDFAGNTTAYPNEYSGILYDYRTTSGQSLGNAVGADAYVPVTGGAWAYNLLAPKTATDLTAPHIVIPISNIETKSGTAAYNGIWYLTVSSLVYQGNKIDHLEPGKVYSIKNISFSHTNIQPEPEMETIDVTVEVTLVEWEILDTDVIFGQD